MTLSVSYSTRGALAATSNSPSAVPATGTPRPTHQSVAGGYLWTCASMEIVCADCE